MRKSLNQIDFFDAFKDEKACQNYLINARWNNGMISCPHCGFERCYTMSIYIQSKEKENVFTYKCSRSSCRKKFSIIGGTIFQNTKVPLRTWFYLIYAWCLAKKNTSSLQAAKNFGVTQKTMWGMQMKIRKLLTQDPELKLKGVVEVDECFVSKGNRWTRWGGISTRKAPIVGIIERGGKIVIKTIQDRTRATLLEEIKKVVMPGSVIYTDGHASYRSLIKEGYQHDFVEHSTGEYVRGEAHTQNIENAWGQLKRSIRYAHHSVSEKHIQAYCDETAWRINNRNLTIAEKFKKVIDLCVNKTHHDIH